MNSRGIPLRVPIRTNLRKVEFEFEFSKHLPRPWRSLRLEENGLFMLALLLASCWRETLRWSVSAQTRAYSPREHVWRTASPSPQHCCLAQTRRGAFVAHCSSGFPFTQRAHQLSAHSTASCSNNWAELGCFLRVFIWQPERMRRPISRTAEQMLP